MDKSSYAKRLQAQISQYANVENMHRGLSDIAPYWKAKFIQKGVREVFDVRGQFEFYAKPFLKAMERSASGNLLSIGSGDAAVEIDVAKMMRKANADFCFELLELSPIQIQRAKRNVEKAGLTAYFEFTEEDVNQWSPNRQYAAIMAHHSLHHVQNLEGLFDSVKGCLLGYFCTMDIIGRNGHMRWPEVLELVQMFWAIIPAEKRKHATLKNFEKGFYNYDCSKQGFEGIRAQDILPCLVERFGFESFFAFGGLIDPFVGRGFGHHYDANKEWDRSFIDLVAYLNDVLIDCGYIKPTQMYAVMTTDAATIPKTYRGRTPEACIHPTDK
jgi:hypothetical protein